MHFTVKISTIIYMFQFDYTEKDERGMDVYVSNDPSLYLYFYDEGLLYNGNWVRI
jgi:hypothetical protein